MLHLSFDTSLMKAVILAGGLGTRLSEVTNLIPKPMVEIGGKPILWHIMKIYSRYNINEFVICCGYKGYVIKEYFANYFLHNSDITLHMDEDRRMEIHHRKTEPWKVTLIDTGESTQTGGRLLRVRSHLGDSPFCFTYGDGVANVDMNQLISFHLSNGQLATLTAVQPPGRYGSLKFDGTNIERFQEKPIGDNAWINGGFFVLNTRIFDFIEGDHSSWESDVLPRIAELGELNAYRHSGYWQSMDTLRDRKKLEDVWNSGNAPWISS